MKKINISQLISSVLVIGGMIMCIGCETEQSASKNNNGMVGYAQKQAQVQAELTNQEQLKKHPLPQNRVELSGTKQTLNLNQ